jgi:AcrR family transcriptional regulator
VRLGGEAGTEAVVRALHDRVRGDPDLAGRADRAFADAARTADSRHLARVLGPPDAHDGAESGVLVSRRRPHGMRPWPEATVNFRLTATPSLWLSAAQMKATRPYMMSARADSTSATKERIVQSALELFFENWYEDVTLAAIAKAAGVSHQTVLNHFESKEGVARATAELLRAETTSRRYEAKPGDIEGAIHVLVGEYERFGDANVRWTATAERLESIAELLDDGRRLHREWIEHVFASYLPIDARARRRARNAVFAATDVYTWKLLRRDLHASRAETERTMVDLVTGTLDRHASARSTRAPRRTDP